jgi:hypothetical protein
MRNGRWEGIWIWGLGIDSCVAWSVRIVISELGCRVLGLEVPVWILGGGIEGSMDGEMGRAPK